MTTCQRTRLVKQRLLTFKIRSANYLKGSAFGRDIDLHTVIKCDIKDKKGRVTVTGYIEDGRYFQRDTKLYHAFSHEAKVLRS